MFVNGALARVGQSVSLTRRKHRERSPRASQRFASSLLVLVFLEFFELLACFLHIDLVLLSYVLHFVQPGVSPPVEDSLLPVKARVKLGEVHPCDFALLSSLSSDSRRDRSWLPSAPRDEVPLRAYVLVSPFATERVAWSGHGLVVRKERLWSGGPRARLTKPFLGAVLVTV